MIKKTTAPGASDAAEKAVPVNVLADPVVVKAEEPAKPKRGRKTKAEAEGAAKPAAKRGRKPAAKTTAEKKTSTRRSTAKKAEGPKKPTALIIMDGFGHREETKGNAQTKATYELLKAESRINFVGNVEGSYLFSGKVADVIVCDGFVGNTALKMAEGLYRINTALGCRNAFWDAMNYENVGGTPVLGVNAPVIIGHGCSSPQAIRSMILSTEQVIKADLTAKLQRAFQN